MAVPAWSIYNSSPLLNLCSKDHVLEDFVDGMPDMEGAVGVGWPIVENEGIFGRSVCRLPRVQVVGTPLKILLLKLRIWPSSDRVDNIELATRRVESKNERVATYGNLDEGSFNVDFHDFDMAASKAYDHLQARLRCIEVAVCWELLQLRLFQKSHQMSSHGEVEISTRLNSQWTTSPGMR